MVFWGGTGILELRQPRDLFAPDCWHGGGALCRHRYIPPRARGQSSRHHHPLSDKIASPLPKLLSDSLFKKHNIKDQCRSFVHNCKTKKKFHVYIFFSQKRSSVNMTTYFGWLSNGSEHCENFRNSCFKWFNSFSLLTTQASISYKLKKINNDICSKWKLFFTSSVSLYKQIDDLFFSNYIQTSSELLVGAWNLYSSCSILYCEGVYTSRKGFLVE